PIWAEDFDPYAGPTPIAVLIQTNPWASVLDADTPLVVVYENGEVIFVKRVDGKYGYQHTTLTEDGLKQFRKDLEPVVSLGDLRPWYSMTPQATDQPISMFYLRNQERVATSRVYGLRVPGTGAMAYTHLPNSPKPDVPPIALRRLHKRLYRGDFPGGSAWTPKYIEVMFSNYDNAPDASIQWPTDWPGLDSERALKRGDSYSIFLDIDMVPKLSEFLKNRNPKGAIELGGKKWGLSTRAVFPREPVWRKALWGVADENQ
ncbi:MAG: hypothetical protein JSS02_25045, partial [Planctomycetes bacterium]|nr:hypothetical protein [Planctomycetota bacterium]